MMIVEAKWTQWAGCRSDTAEFRNRLEHSNGLIEG